LQDNTHYICDVKQTNLGHPLHVLKLKMFKLQGGFAFPDPLCRGSAVEPRYIFSMHSTTE